MRGPSEDSPPCPSSDGMKFRGMRDFEGACIFSFETSLDSVLLTESLIESYKAFKGSKKEYPFVEMRELKPRAKIHGPEYPDQRSFIVIFAEDTIPTESKPQIRFFDSNKVTKENFGLLALFDLQDVFHQRMRYFENSEFCTVAQESASSRLCVVNSARSLYSGKYRFGLSHFHVKIDWPVANAAEDLGRHLKYISRHLYRKRRQRGRYSSTKTL